jgi:hypothetical protein
MRQYYVAILVSYVAHDDPGSMRTGLRLLGSAQPKWKKVKIRQSVRRTSSLLTVAHCREPELLEAIMSLKSILRLVRLLVRRPGPLIRLRNFR